MFLKCVTHLREGFSRLLLQKELLNLGWAAMGPAEIEKRALLFLRRKDKKASPDVTRILKDLQEMPHVEKVTLAW